MVNKFNFKPLMKHSEKLLLDKHVANDETKKDSSTNTDGNCKCDEWENVVKERKQFGTIDSFSGSIF